jgi:hypothetical protein
MHDIICPQCGESFIAREVVFDFSQYIQHIVSDVDNRSEAKELGFKYYIDEEEILNNAKPDNMVDLQTDNRIGPGNDHRNYFRFSVTNDMIFNYIAQKAGLNPVAFADEIGAIAADKRASARNYETRTIASITKAYYCCFSSNLGAMGDDGFDITSTVGAAVVRMLCYIYENRHANDDMSVRLYCHRMNVNRKEYYIPDILFVLGQSMQMEQKRKCCRCCGVNFPDEFGYYKMVPVTMLGSAYSAKTSFLLAMLWFVRNMPPFTTSTKVKISTLNNDPDLVAFNNNIKNYNMGLAPIKTDFKKAPILSFLINETIYTFTDWPGEAFINNEEGDLQSYEYAFDTKRIIHKSKHFVCCLDPEQIAPGISKGIEERDEENYYDDVHLMSRLNEHIKYARKVNSISIVVNKFDLFITSQDPDSNEIRAYIDDIIESDIMDANGRWNDEKWNNINNKTHAFLSHKIPTFASNTKQTHGTSNSLVFLPVAPYGKFVGRDEENASRVRSGKLVGLPLLHILKADKVI